MRLLKFIVAAIITVALIIFLNSKWGTLPPFGKLFSPQEGFWQNAEPADENFTAQLHCPQLHDPVKVWLDKRLVPHVFAQNDHDLYFVQGYLTAKFRLWQMEIQVMAAAGRASEILGPSALQFDRMQRRKGMIYAAENSLKDMEADTAMHQMLDAYTAGVNAYIHTLTDKTLPLEYKLLDYWPHTWTNLNSALLLKYMSDELTGYSNDLEYTNLRNLFSDSLLDMMFPDFPDSLQPIIPAGTKFGRPLVQNPSSPPDSDLVQKRSIHFSFDKPDPTNGSNNWAISGSKTLSGAPILCNDPHLGLNLPSLWFEMQLQTPNMNVYGVTLPGAPTVIIGFDDSIAWGETNAARDVKDFYAVKFKDSSEQEYWFNGQYRKAKKRIEKINIRGEKPFYDTVTYTVWGPVIYDKSFPDKITNHPYLALHWQALQPSDELKTFYLLNRAHNYNDYVNALQYFDCPGQNFAFASKAGNIAIWQQGKFPLRWKDQGKYIMPGIDSSFVWQGYVPFRDNPHIENPERGFVSSANQHPTDQAYPYYYTGDFFYYRAKRINEVLSSKNLFSIRDMMKLQTDVYDEEAAEALPVLLHFLPQNKLSKQEAAYLSIVSSWNKMATPQSKAPAIFYNWLDSLMNDIWEDELAKDSLPNEMPSVFTTMEWLKRDSTMPFVDNINTKQKETISMLDLDAFHQALKGIVKADSAGKLAWGIYRGTDIKHLTGLPAFSRMHLYTGGDEATVNATESDHGPSWRMIVQLSKKTEAYGIYPGGQSGNPGSKYYDDMIDDWLLGRYYPLLVLQPNDIHNPNIAYRINFQK